MNEHQELAIRALENMRSDDLPRARRAFAGHTVAQMSAQYGQSGQTCAEILASYEEAEARIDAAIAWVRAQ